jgi:hypothetical protein
MLIKASLMQAKRADWVLNKASILGAQQSGLDASEARPLIRERIGAVHPDESNVSNHFHA